MKTVVMKHPMANAEQHFMHSVQQAQVLELNVGPQVLELEQWLATLLQAIQTSGLINTVFSPDATFVQNLVAIQDQLQHYPQKWANQWQELKPALQMADVFADKLMFLVFGKFNAGKSSFCNLLVDRFAAYGLATEYFVLDAGQVQSSAGPFKEGTTETTAYIQGAILANRLVLIDTPGLHSASQENADLTQRFLDSADAMLWLSSSTSPGQVQELEELALELRRRKPLMPIITRSDFLDEDIVDNQIVNVLCNKSPDNRTLQEEDVLSRAHDKLMQLGLDSRLVKAPLSLSAYAARAHGLTEQALEEAGIYRFYQAVTQMINPLLNYKAKKPLAIYLHHLEENVANDIKVCCENFAQYHAALNTERSRLNACIELLSESIWREVISHILRLLDAYFAGAGDIKALQQGLIESMAQEYQAQVEQSLAGMYSLPAHLVAAKEFKAPLIDAYFASSKTLRTDDFEKIYLHFESLLSRQVRENLQQLQQYIDAELALMLLNIEQLQERMQHAITVLHAKKAAWI